MFCFASTGRKKILILNVEVCKLLCYNETSVCRKDLRLLCQSRGSIWPSTFDLHDIMSSFISLILYFLILTLQEDLRTLQAEFKRFESCLNVCITKWSEYSLLPWTYSTLDCYLNLAFQKWTFSYLDIMTASAPTVSQTCCPNAKYVKDRYWYVIISIVNWLSEWAALRWFGVLCLWYVAETLRCGSMNLGG